MKRKKKEPKPHVVGEHNGVEIALRAGTHKFYALGVRDKIGCSIEGISFKQVAKRLDKLGLRGKQTDRHLAGRICVVFERYAREVDFVGKLTGKFRDEWVHTSYRARFERMVEVVPRGGGEPQWLNGSRVGVVSAARAVSLLSLVRKVQLMRKSLKRADEKLDKRLDKIKRAGTDG